MVEFIRCQQTITTTFANRPFQAKPKAAVKKYNLVPLTRPYRAKLSQPGRINVRKFLEATQLNWASNIGNSLTQEAKDAAQSMSTSLAPTQGCQLLDTQSMPSPTSPAAPAKITEHSIYWLICTVLGKTCLEGFSSNVISVG